MHGTPHVQNASALLQSTATTLQLEHKTTQGETPELTVLHHTPDTNVSRVNTTAVCATVAHIPCNETSTTLEPSAQTTDDETASLPTLPPLDHHREGDTRNETLMTLEPNAQSTDDETISLPTLPPLDHDREGDTLVAGSTTNLEPVTICHLNELAATLDVQM